MAEILEFTKDVDRYRRMAQTRADEGDLLGALSLLYTALSVEESDEIYMEIGYIYADMGLYELSNKYWFKYIALAPKDRVSIAYEELAINFFYMDNYIASSVYFHKKITCDGHISREGLSQEIIDFFSGEEIKRDAYRIVYPYNLANYNFEIKIAKHSLAIGAFEEAKNRLSLIPKERRTEEISGDLAISHFMTDDLDGAEKVCRDSISRHGENLTAYCNLSTIYDMREDDENADYYYKKALSMEKGDKGEEYKLATCAIERFDHKTVQRCIEKILIERPYELAMRFFYGLTFLNLGEYQRAVEELSKTYRLDPNDMITGYYLGLAKRFLIGQESDKILPLEYVRELPKDEIKKNQDLLEKLIKSDKKISTALKNNDLFNAVKWGLIHGDGQTARNASFLMVSCALPKAKKTLFDALLDPNVKEETKRAVIYMLVVDGYKQKFGVVNMNYYLRIKPKRLKLEKVKDAYTGQFIGAYGLCMMRAVSCNEQETDKIALMTDKVFFKLKDKICPGELTDDELGALIFSLCKFEWCKRDTDVVRLFGIDKQKLQKLKEMIKD
jgi:tetratricopeptide (TPR) repeat protein